MGWLAPQWIGNGNRGETEVATLDGADATDAEMGTVQFWNFNLDAIAEFKVQQGNYSAEYGQRGWDHHPDRKQIRHQPVPRQRL